MGVFKRISDRFRRKSASTNDEQWKQLAEWLGIDSNQPRGALAEATYFACLKVLSESIGKLPLKLQKSTSKNGVSTVWRDPRYIVVHDRPNPYMTSTMFWSTMEHNRNHFGNAYALIHGAGTVKNPMSLWILPPDRITIVNDDKDLFNNGANKIYYVYSSPEGEIYTFHNEEILHVKSSSTVDGYVGVSVRERLATTIDGNVNAQKMLNGLYKSGYTAKAVLEYTGDLSDVNVQKYVKGIERYAKGTNTDDLSSIIPIPVGSKLTPLNISLADGQFIEIKKYSALQIASAFGIKPNQIGDYEKSSYASAEAQQLSFYVDTLLFIVKQYEEELSFKLLSFDEMRKGYRFKFNVDVILRADFKTKVETLSKAVNTFLYTPNEAREKLDLEAVEGGDSLMGNGSTVKLEQVGIQYRRAEPSTSTDSGGEGGETDGEGTEESDGGASA